MDHKQPNVVNVRNGPSRGRSRSVSRSRSRSPSARKPRDGVVDGVVRRDQRTWTDAPNGDQLWGALVLRRLAEEGSTVTVREMQAVIGPKTFAALMKLLEASLPDFRNSKLDDAIPISALAQAVGPETMAPLCLTSILVEVAKASAAQQAAKDKEAAESHLQTLRAMGQKVTLDELHKNIALLQPSGDNASDMKPAGCLTTYAADKKSFHINVHNAFLDLVTKVGNKHTDIGLDTRIDLGVVAAETGPDTMSLSTLIKLVLATPSSNRAPATTTQGHVQQQPLHDEGYHRREQTLEGIRRELAEDRAKLPAFRAQNAAILAASTNPYYQSLAAPATTQGYVQQQPSIFNPQLLRMQQELDEQMRSDPWLRHLARTSGLDPNAPRWQQELDEQARALGARFP